MDGKQIRRSPVETWVDSYKGEAASTVNDFIAPDRRLSRRAGGQGGRPPPKEGGQSMKKLSAPNTTAGKPEGMHFFHELGPPLCGLSLAKYGEVGGGGSGIAVCI